MDGVSHYLFSCLLMMHWRLNFDVFFFSCFYFSGFSD